MLGGCDVDLLPSLIPNLTEREPNKDLLDTYTQTEANLADAVTKKHEHENKTVLDGITEAKVTAWDNAEKNAKAYADGIKEEIADFQLIDREYLKIAQSLFPDRDILKEETT